MVKYTEIYVLKYSIFFKIYFCDVLDPCDSEA